MNILITGGAGFVGTHLIKALSESHEVFSIDNFKHSVDPSLLNDEYKDLQRQVKYGDCALNFETAVNLKDIEAVIHFAATINVDYSVEEPWQSVYNNAIGVLNVVEACRKWDLKLIFASTCEIYGSIVEPTKPQSEEHPQRPFSPYGASKLAGEKICESYHDTYGMKINVLRPFNIFGPFQRSSSYGAAIAIFTDRALQGLPPQIFGDGFQTRDYTYVPDVVEAYRIALEKDFGGEPVNFGTGREITVNELAELVCTACGRPNLVPEHVAPRKRELRRSWCDFSKAIAKFGFKPKFTFEDGLKAYIKWVRTLKS